ncbi:ParB-like nuclease domain-containing protein [Oribacterium sp. KHPX15]|uniref:ParB N-terminal domain-containing protein n=1 Tax=unclassified Oribacterium TaxID=2629782 RepID=UPI0004E119FB|nr:MULTISPECIES: ParB N-terminal domain-containing protein [unclassified Oribacterium]SEA74727.1 ParB-like nuclease domain-containing protein [Oribacterium sp. KHPX15]
MAAKKDAAPLGYNNAAILFQNTQKKLDTVSLDLGNGSKIEMIQYEKLVTFPNNRDIDDTDIDIFSENIERNGFQSAIVVAREFDGGEERTGKATGNYIIISGHRRYAAFSLILERNPSFMHRKLPALILRDDIPWTELEELNLLMNYDAVSESSHPGDMRKRVSRLMELLQSRGIEKKLYDRIAEKLSISSRQIRKYDSINKNLIVGLQTLLDEEKISINQANQYASRSIDVQNYILNYINEHGEAVTEDEYQQLKSQDEERQAAQKATEEKLRENEQKLKEQENEILRLKNKTLELESLVNSDQETDESSSLELINTQAQLRRAKEKADKYHKILKEAKEADEEQLNKSIGISAPIAVNEMISKINDNVIKLVKRKEKRGYQFSKNDVQKIRTIIDDLQSLISDV